VSFRVISWIVFDVTEKTIHEITRNDTKHKLFPRLLPSGHFLRACHNNTAPVQKRSLRCVAHMPPVRFSGFQPTGNYSTND